MSENLIFLTNRYPNVDGDVFVENEIRYLENYFENIIIICAKEKMEGVNRYIPKNAKVFFFNENLSFFQKLRGIQFFFNYIFWQEILFARKNLNIKFNLIKLKILYIDLIKGYLLSKYIKIIYNKYPKEVTYYYSYWSDYKAVACAFLKKDNSQIKAFSRNHGWDIYFYVNIHKYLPLRKFIFDHLDGIYCVSEYGVNYLKTELKFQHHTFFVSKLGTYNTCQHHKLYSTFNSLLIVSCSNLFYVKRIELIIDSLSLISDIQINWVHFGDGPLKDLLINHSNKLKAMNNLKFDFKGQTNNDDIMAFYEKNQVDLFINVSKSEGIPVSIMEAMSYGIPTIATAVGGTSEIVIDRYNGFLLSQNPTNKMVAQAITKFFYLPIEEKLIMRQNAYNTWHNEYNAEKNYKVFVDTILSL